jgi:hypothetical protein
MHFGAALSEVASNYHDRYWWRERVQDRIAAPVLARLNSTEGVDVVERDWDNLLVLDACRADMFESVVDTSSFDTYDSVTSQGSSSPDWIAANFAGRDLGDTVYITANPWVAREAPANFHRIVDVWSETQDEETLETTDLEDRDLSTSPSATVSAQRLNTAARRVAGEYPNKRYIVHYFQPHAPCIGNRDGTVKADDELDLRLHPGQPLYEGQVERSDVWEAYEQNLSYVFKHAESLATDLGGKSVFTADHGELFGERLWPVPIRGYAHPRGLRHPKLVTVPWGEKSIGDRRNVTADGTTRTDATSDEVTEQLEKLGYL